MSKKVTVILLLTPPRLGWFESPYLLSAVLGVTKLGLWRLCLPHLTQASFLHKSQTLLNVILISVKLKCHSVVKNNEIWTFKVNFLCQKLSQYFIEEY